MASLYNYSFVQYLGAGIRDIIWAVLAEAEAGGSGRVLWIKPWKRLG